MRSFGKELNRFALAVSSIDESKWREFVGTLNTYFKGQLGVHHFHVMVDGIRVGDEPGLKTIWSSTEMDRSDPIFKDGEYYGLRSLSYHKGQYLWIVSETEGLIADKKAKLKDLWNDTPQLPPYQETPGVHSKTAVFAPLRFGGKIFGVFLLEHPDHKQISPEAKAEIASIAEALARIVWVWQTTSEQLQTVERALTEFKAGLEDTRPVLERPKVFLAYPQLADDDVLDCITGVLEDLEERIDRKSWEDIPEPGNISSHIIDEISKSHLGICYVSQRVEQRGKGAKRKYVDNENVLFEAGMFHALQANKESPNRGWIPVREDEKYTGPPCFDIAGERTIVVPRDGRGAIDKAAFQKRLNEMIQAAIDA